MGRALVSQRTWVRIPFWPECFFFFSGFNFTTARVVCVTAMINHKFIVLKSDRGAINRLFGYMTVSRSRFFTASETYKFSVKKNNVKTHCDRITKGNYEKEG